MELNIPIRAVKQKPMANMDFMRTCRETQPSLHTGHATESASTPHF